jgi:hypothetical protein
MIFKKYIHFRNEFLSENVDASKTFMKKLYLRRKKESGTQENPIGLSGEEQKLAVNDPDFLRIKNMLVQDPGFTFLFTKFHFQNGVSLDNLKDMYNLLKSQSKNLNLLPIDPSTNKPMGVLKYANLTPEDEKKIYSDGITKGGYERLTDDLMQIDRKKKAKKFTDELTVKFRKEYEGANDNLRKQIDNIGVAFAELGASPDGTIDKKMNHDLQRLFWSKISGDKSLNDLIERAKNHIKSSNTNNLGKFMQVIYDVNSKFGDNNGVEIVYNENNILIVDVKSFRANKMLNANTSHCIANSDGHWYNYVGFDKKQYYIYNWNLPANDISSVIGVTIDPKQKITAAHYKNDDPVGGKPSYKDPSIREMEIKKYLGKLNIPFSILSPMDEEEIKNRQKKIAALDEIKKPNISLESLKKYYEEGLDIHIGDSISLHYAVDQDDYEKAKFLLSVGANPNNRLVINKAKSFKMVKLLLGYGSILSTNVFDIIGKDMGSDGNIDELEYIINTKQGADLLNSNESGSAWTPVSHPLSMAISINNMKAVKFLISKGCKVNIRNYVHITRAIKKWLPEMLDYLFSVLEKEGDPVLESGDTKNNKFKEWLDILQLEEDHIKQNLRDKPLPPFEETKNVLLKWRDKK